MTDKTKEIETQIAQRIVWDALGAGYEISVLDGEEFPIVRSRDEKAILAALRSTDEDVLFFFVPGERIRTGWVKLIWGNGVDLISDYRDTKATEAILAPALRLALQLQSEVA